MIPNPDGSFSFTESWSREDIELALEKTYKTPVPQGDRTIKLIVFLPTEEAAQRFLENFNTLCKEELKRALL